MSEWGSEQTVPLWENESAEGGSETVLGQWERLLDKKLDDVACVSIEWDKHEAFERTEDETENHEYWVTSLSKPSDDGNNDGLVM